MIERVIASVLLLLIVGPAAAEPIKKPAKTMAVNPPPASKDTKTEPKAPPANELFGAATTPAPLAARSIGSYAKGCYLIFLSALLPMRAHSTVSLAF